MAEKNQLVKAKITDEQDEGEVRQVDNVQQLGNTLQVDGLQQAENVHQVEAGEVEKSVQQKVPSSLGEPKIRPRSQLIVVTGFGPFTGHEKRNASWEAVKLLPDTLNYYGFDFVVQKRKVPVEYRAVDQQVVDIWAGKPDLVIHCGVHGLANRVHVERYAYNHCFCRPDYAGFCLNSATVELANRYQNNLPRDKLQTQLDTLTIVNSVVDDFARDPVGEVTEQLSRIAKISDDVGDYLCGYIYLKSLDIDNKRTLFVHVPPINKPLSTNITSQVINRIIDEAMKQVVLIEDDDDKA